MAGTDSTTRRPATRGESERLGLTGCVVVKSLLRKGIEPSRANILLDLAIPRRPVELEEPRTKLRKLLRRKRLNLLLDLLDLTHDHHPVRIVYHRIGAAIRRSRSAAGASIASPGPLQREVTRSRCWKGSKAAWKPEPPPAKTPTRATLGARHRAPLIRQDAVGGDETLDPLRIGGPVEPPSRRRGSSVTGWA